MESGHAKLGRALLRNTATNVLAEAIHRALGLLAWTDGVEVFIRGVGPSPGYAEHSDLKLEGAPAPQGTLCGVQWSKQEGGGDVILSAHTSTTIFLWKIRPEARAGQRSSFSVLFVETFRNSMCKGVVKGVLWHPTQPVLSYYTGDQVFLHRFGGAGDRLCHDALHAIDFTVRGSLTSCAWNPNGRTLAMAGALEVVLKTFDDAFAVLKTRKVIVCGTGHLCVITAMGNGHFVGTVDGSIMTSAADVGRQVVELRDPFRDPDDEQPALLRPTPDAGGVIDLRGKLRTAPDEFSGVHVPRTAVGACIPDRLLLSKVTKTTPASSNGGVFVVPCHGPSDDMLDRQHVVPTEAILSPDLLACDIDKRVIAVSTSQSMVILLYRIDIGVTLFPIASPELMNFQSTDRCKGLVFSDGPCSGLSIAIGSRIQATDALFTGLFVNYNLFLVNWRLPAVSSSERPTAASVQGATGVSTSAHHPFASMSPGVSPIRWDAGDDASDCTADDGGVPGVTGLTEVGGRLSSSSPVLSTRPQAPTGGSGGGRVSEQLLGEIGTAVGQQRGPLDITAMLATGLGLGLGSRTTVDAPESPPANRSPLQGRSSPGRGALLSDVGVALKLGGPVDLTDMVAARRQNQQGGANAKPNPNPNPKSSPHPNPNLHPNPNPAGATFPAQKRDAGAGSAKNGREDPRTDETLTLARVKELAGAMDRRMDAVDSVMHQHETRIESVRMHASTKNNDPVLKAIEGLALRMEARFDSIETTLATHGRILSRMEASFQ